MSPKRMRQTGQLSKLMKIENELLEAELFGQSSSHAPNNVQAVAIDDADREQDSDHPCDENIAEEENISDRIDSDDSENENDSDLEDDEYDIPEAEPIDETIRKWALRSYVTPEALNSLMDILRMKTNFRLPEDAHTLLGIRQSDQEITSIAGGELWYPGVIAVLEKHFRNNKEQLSVSSMSLNFYINGLPLSKDTRKQFWPMLMTIHELPEVPVLMVGNFLGDSKPKSVEQYLRPLVTELNVLMANGVFVNDKLIDVRVGAIIAEAPARAFIKGVSYFNNKHGCHKCTVVGKYHDGERVVYFPPTDAPPRTDEDFRTLKYGDYHREATPFTDLLHFDMIAGFPSTDSMLLFDYGVTRTFLGDLQAGKLGTHPPWCVETISRINKILNNVEIPPEFHRKLRSIEDTGVWKTSEFNIFLHYASFIVFKHILTEAEYKHFMLYYCATTMFSSHVYRAHWPEAARMLKQFVAEYGVLYGEYRLTSAVHNLVHVYEDVCRFGPLKSFSTYRFKSKLLHVKHTLRNGHQVLVQAANGISELASPSPGNKHPVFPYLQPKGVGIAVHVDANISLYPGPPDNWFLTKDFYIVKYCSANVESSGVVIHGKAFKKLTESHTYHCSPLMANIYEAKICDFSTEMMDFLTTDIKCKLVAIKTSDIDYVFVPLLHTLVE